jgi:hypothetical protein
MYVVKFSSESLFFRVTLFEKQWSEEMLSNSMTEIDSRRFMFYCAAKRWVDKTIVRLLIKQKKMEIIDR